VSAVEDYREAREGSFYKVTALTITMKADAAIAELEAEIEHKCDDCLLKTEQECS